MNSEITLPVPELKAALPSLNKLIGRKFTLPVLGHVRVTRTTSGQVRLQAADFDSQATYTFTNTQPGEAMDLVVPVEQLNKALKCSTDQEQAVALVMNDKTTKLRYYIGGSAVNQTIATLPIAEWLVMPEITAQSTPLQSGFGLALKEALQCCSEDSSRYILQGACLDARDDKAHYVVGTNGYCLYSANSFTFPLKESIVIRDSKFITSSALLDNECSLAVQSVPVKLPEGVKPRKTDHQTPPVKYISLQSDRWQFVTREIEGQYPNWKQVVPALDSSWTRVILSEAALEQLLKVIPNLPGKEVHNRPVKLRVDGKTLWIDGRNAEDEEWTKIAITDVTIEGKPRMISLNRNQLLPALKFGLNELAILDELSPMVCRKEGKRLVIMPLHPSVQTTKPSSVPQQPTSTPANAPDKPTHTTSATPTTPPQPIAEAQPEPATTTPIQIPTQTQTQPQERKTDMTKATSPTTTAPETTSIPDSPFKLAMQQVEALREVLKTVQRDLASLNDTLKVAEKEKKASDKEIEQVREKLREIQGMKI